MKRVLIRTLPVLIFTIMSCSKDMNVSSADIVTLIDNGLYVSKTDTVIKSTDAVKVANLFSFNGTEATKGNFSKSVKSVNEFKDSESELGVYVVNYEGGGWVLVSSTKKHYPILAYSNKGCFDTDTLNGVSLYVDSYKKEINRKHKLPTSEVKEEIEAWKVYEGRDFPETYLTRNNDELSSLIGQSVLTWQHEGYDVYSITEDVIDGLPIEVLEEFRAIARSAEDYGDEYHNTSFILKWTESHPSNYNNYQLTTEWGQGGEYNDHVPEDNLLGCVTVAIGQIMWYHKHHSLLRDMVYPTFSQMDTISYMLADIRANVVTDSLSYEGGSNIYRAKTYFEEEGYDLQLEENHTYANISSALGNYGPVFMRGGLASDPLSGHAWVCDGFTYYTSYRMYKLMTISIFNGLNYVESASYGPVQSVNVDYYHMNWGYDGNNNGWYTQGASMLGYDYGRMSLIDIRPN